MRVRLTYIAWHKLIPHGWAAIVLYQPMAGTALLYQLGGRTCKYTATRYWQVLPSAIPQNCAEKGVRSFPGSRQAVDTHGGLTDCHRKPAFPSVSPCKRQFPGSLAWIGRMAGRKSNRSASTASTVGGAQWRQRWKVVRLDQPSRLDCRRWVWTSTMVPTAGPSPQARRLPSARLGPSPKPAPGHP